MASDKLSLFIFQMDVKAVPLDENEMRALISVSLPCVRAQNKDLQCACVCDPPEPLPRVSGFSCFILHLKKKNQNSLIYRFTLILRPCQNLRIINYNQN